MSERAALLERVKKATGPDRGLDGFIARDLLGWLPYFDLTGKRIVLWHEYAGHWHLPGDPCDGRHSISEKRNPDPPEFTASIDAALTLVEKCLPGWWLFNLSERRRRIIYASDNHDPLSPRWTASLQSYSGGQLRTDIAETPPLAILAALLQAKLVEPQP